MRKYLFFSIIGVLAFGCADKKAQEQSLMDSVVSAHDKLMGLDEQLIKNQNLLDTLIRQKLPAVLVDSAKTYRNRVALADSAMMVWMHGFDPDLTKRSHDDNMRYLHKQKALIAHIDSQMTSALNTSGAYLAKNKKK